MPKTSFALGYRRSTENLTVTNCVLTTACNCFKLGTESSGDFKNITVSNCAMFARPDLWKRMPSSGLALEMVDGASLERIAVSNIVMVDIESPLFIRLGNRGRAQIVPKPEHLEGISIAGVVATGATRASSVTGIPGYPARQITLQNIRITAKGGGSAALARKDVPELENKYPDADMFDDLPAYGLFCRHAETLVLDNVHFHLEQADARPAVIFDRVEDLDLRTVSAAPPSGTSRRLCCATCAAASCMPCAPSPAPAPSASSLARRPRGSWRPGVTSLMPQLRSSLGQRWTSPP